MDTADCPDLPCTAAAAVLRSAVHQRRLREAWRSAGRRDDESQQPLRDESERLRGDPDAADAGA